MAKIRQKMGRRAKAFYNRCWNFLTGVVSLVGATLSGIYVEELPWVDSATFIEKLGVVGIMSWLIYLTMEMVLKEGVKMALRFFGQDTELEEAKARAELERERADIAEQARNLERERAERAERERERAERERERADDIIEWLKRQMEAGATFVAPSDEAASEDR